MCGVGETALWGNPPPTRAYWEAIERWGNPPPTRDIERLLRGEGTRPQRGILRGYWGATELFVIPLWCIKNTLDIFKNWKLKFEYIFLFFLNFQKFFRNYKINQEMYSNLKMKKIIIFWCLYNCSVNLSIFIIIIEIWLRGYREVGEPAPNAGYREEGRIEEGSMGPVLSCVY